MVALIGAWTYIQFHNAPGYTTDELSFDQYAAQLVAHGLHNPYVHSMAPAGPLFRLSPDGYTYTTSGTPVLAMSYPSLSFLIYVPFILLGWTNEVGAGLNVAAWVVAILLMFWLLPRQLRPAVLVLSSIDVYLAFAAGRRHGHALHPAADRGGLQVGSVRDEPRLLPGAGRDGTRDGDQADALAGARLRALRAGDGRVRPPRAT